MADSGLPRGGGVISRGRGETYDFAKFSQKLHEIESGPPGAHVPHTPLDPPLSLHFGGSVFPKTAESNPGFATE